MTVQTRGYTADSGEQDTQAGQHACQGVRDSWDMGLMRASGKRDTQWVSRRQTVCRRLRNCAEDFELHPEADGECTGGF